MVHTCSFAVLRIVVRNQWCSKTWHTEKIMYAKVMTCHVIWFNVVKCSVVSHNVISCHIISCTVRSAQLASARTEPNDMMCLHGASVWSMYEKHTWHTHMPALNLRHTQHTCSRTYIPYMHTYIHLHAIQDYTTQGKCYTKEHKHIDTCIHTYMHALHTYTHTH